MRVTIKGIAQELGISHSTVSRVLNDKQSHLVSPATRERILAAAAQMGYRPNQIARALQGKSSRLIGVFLPDSEDYFFQSVTRYLRRTLNESGYELMVFACTAGAIADTWHRLLQWDLDGVFVFDYLFMVDGLQEALTRHRGGAIPPMVALFSTQQKLTDSVVVDFRAGVERLLEHFMELGCRTLGFLNLPANLNAREQRCALFCEFVDKRGLNRALIPTAEGEEHVMRAAYLGVQTWIRSGSPLPQALFCQNDEMALGAYRALYEAGIAVPGQILLAGCDNLPYCAYLETPLTSLVLPTEEVCRLAWLALQQRLADPQAPPIHHTLEVEVAFRPSTGTSQAAS